jgi:integrase
LEAARAYSAQLHSRRSSQPLADAIPEYVEGIKIDGRSTRYYNDMNYALRRFLAHYELRVAHSDVTLKAPTCAEVSTGQIEYWLRELVVGEATRNANRKRLLSFFAYAVARGWCEANPVTGVPLAREHSAAPGILEPEQLRALLFACATATRPYWVIGAFAGLRSIELERLEWRDIRWRSWLIEVGAAKSKTATKRFVKIEPVLAAWLEDCHGRDSGMVAPAADLRKHLIADRQAAGIEKWPANALRHSFASYHLAHFHDAARLALELGHTSTYLIFRHYRELVTPEAAREYWNQYPKMCPLPSVA